MPQTLKIGFPAGLLGESPERLDVLEFRPNRFVCVNKPAKIFMEADGVAEAPKTLIGAIKEQDGKPEFERIGLKNPASVFVLDPEISGVALISCGKEAAAKLRNSFGSEGFQFEFLVLSERPLGEVEELVNLPMLRHESNPRMIVSHRFGKKAKTAFELKEDFGQWQLWSAKTNYLRRHQIRLHAAEAGLRPVGEDTYVRVRKIFVSKLKRGQFKGEDETPMYDNVAIHLSKLSFNFEGEDFEIAAPLPKRFEYMLKRLRSI
ncbi:MAG: hypothetical protein J6P03_08375 [Opitutales bacterium]|nr:hypothetical protein [Opitutales bacterium]